MPSQVKDFLDIIKDIRGTNFDDSGLPTEGYWFDVKTNRAAVLVDTATVAADKAIVAADKAIVAADKATVAADKADVIAANAAAAINLDNIGDAFVVEVTALKNNVDDQVIVAAGHVTTASGHSTSAGVSATTATTKAAEATTARNLAYNWAQNPEDSAIDDGVNPAGFSAYHWSQKAAAVVGGVTDFTDLADVPASYATHGSKYLQVLPGETGVRFVTIVKGDIGLGSVDNTSDTDKPISSAVITALSGKAPITAKYIVQTLDSDLTNEQALGGLASGLLYNTTTTGVLSKATTTNIGTEIGVTGLLKGAGAAAIVAATIRTDYAEPTTALATGILKNTTGTGVHTIAVAGTDYLAPADIGVSVQAYDADTAKLDVDQSWTGAQRGTPTTDNDLSFDLAAANNFTCTPSAGGTLTFTNHTSGQSGFVLLVNGSNYAIAAAATTKITTADLTKISATGTYLISYYDNGTNAYCVASASIA